jgi:hypothetical protein
MSDPARNVPHDLLAEARRRRAQRSYEPLPDVERLTKRELPPYEPSRRPRGRRVRALVRSALRS